MPSTMIHLLTALHIEPDGDGAFKLGSFAPDYTNDYAVKDRIHLRRAADRWAALGEMYSNIDDDNAFERGWFVHLFTDACWDEAMYARFRREYGHEDSWFHKYRYEIGAASFHLYCTLPWAHNAWKDIMDCKAEDIQTTMPITTADIAWYRDRVYKKHVESTGEPSAYFTPDRIHAFANETAKRFKAWKANREGSGAIEARYGG